MQNIKQLNNSPSQIKKKIAISGAQNSTTNKKQKIIKSGSKQDDEFLNAGGSIHEDQYEQDQFEDEEKQPVVPHYNYHRNKKEVNQEMSANQSPIPNAGGSQLNSGKNREYQKKQEVQYSNIV